MEATKKVEDIEWVSIAVGELIDELKERLWRDVWKDEIDLPDVKVEVSEVEGGFLVKVRV